MKRSLYSAPEAFSLNPLLFLLPVRSQIGGLGALTSSFYARYEKVKEERQGATSDQELTQKLAAEEAMLRQVLDWLEVSAG